MKKKKLKVKWINVLITLFILKLIIAGVVFYNIDKTEKKILKEIKSSIEYQNISQEQMLGYEPKNSIKNDVKNDVQLIAEEIGIEYELFEAIIRHETGNRTSKAFKELNNPCGMMYWNGKRMALKKYETIEDGYKACAKNLKNNYIDKGLTTIEQIQKKYAPIGINDKGNVNRYWVHGVTSIYNQLKSSE